MSDQNEDRLIYSPISRDEAFFPVSAKASYYPNMARVYIPNVPYQKLMNGLEPAIKPIQLGSRIYEEYETDIERSIRRTRKNIKDIVLCNQFEIFCTFTFKENRSDVDLCKRKMSNWLRNQRARNGKFRYIIVSEFHKKNSAIHFHSLIGGYQGKIEERLVNSKTGKKFKKPKYGFKSYTLGYSDIEFLDAKGGTNTKVAWYIQKYITKDMPLFFGKNRYWVSKNIKRPTEINNPEPWHQLQEPDRRYPLDHGLMIEFDLGSNPIIDMFIEANEP